MTEGISETIPPWRPLLRAAMQREGRSVAARWVQLATTGRDGTPRVRTPVSYTHLTLPTIYSV